MTTGQGSLGGSVWSLIPTYTAVVIVLAILWRSQSALAIENAQKDAARHLVNRMWNANVDTIDIDTALRLQRLRNAIVLDARSQHDSGDNLKYPRIDRLSYAELVDGGFSGSIVRDLKGARVVVVYGLLIDRDQVETVAAVCRPFCPSVYCVFLTKDAVIKPNNFSSEVVK